MYALKPNQNLKLGNIFLDDRIRRFRFYSDIHMGSRFESNLVAFRVRQAVLNSNLVVQGLSTLNDNLSSFRFGRVGRYP